MNHCIGKEDLSLDPVNILERIKKGVLTESFITKCNDTKGILHFR